MNFTSSFCIQQVGISLFCLGLTILQGRCQPSSFRTIGVWMSLSLFKWYISFEDFLDKVWLWQARSFFMIILFSIGWVECQNLLMFYCYSCKQEDWWGEVGGSSFMKDALQKRKVNLICATFHLLWIMFWIMDNFVGKLSWESR